MQDLWDKLHEELAELRAAIDEPGETARARQIADEMGDLLFTVANLARWLQVDAESALRMANARFRRRFERLDVLARAQGRTLPALSTAEKAALWEQVKAQQD